MMLWQIIALFVLVPLALLFAGRTLLLCLMQWGGPAAMQKIVNPGPSKAWIQQQQQSYRSFNTTVKPPVQTSPPLPWSRPNYFRSPYYQQFSKKRDYS